MATSLAGAAPWQWPLQAGQGHALLAGLPACDGQPLHWQAMTEAQLGAVLLIEQAAYPHPWSLRNLQDAIRSGYLTQLLCAGEAPVGYFIAMAGVDEVHLLNITVAPHLQGRGLGKCMLGALAVWARQLGKPQIWLEVRRSNQQAIAAYERFGFQTVGVRKGYYPDTASTREDAMVMTLNLPPAHEPTLEASP